MRKYNFCLIVLLSLAVGTPSKAMEEDTLEKEKKMSPHSSTYPINRKGGLFVGFGLTKEGAFAWVDDREDDHPARTQIFLQDQFIELEDLPKKYCIGSYELESMEGTSCPSKALAFKKLQNCEKCFEKTGFNPAFYRIPRNHLSLQQQIYNQKPHCVYLASFQEGKATKVGLAYTPRLLRRLLEQGALAATVVQHFSGAYMARELEARISKDYKMPEGFSCAEKRIWLKQPFKTDRVLAHLRSQKEKIISELGFSDSPAEILNLWPLYKAENINFREIEDTSLLKQKVQGKYLGLVGDILIYEHSSQKYMCSLKKYVGSSLIRVVSSQKIGL